MNFYSIISYAKSKKWCSNCTATYEDKNLKSLTFQCGLKQIIRDPTNILEISASCIYLSFTSQPNLIMNLAVYFSLHPNFHHPIIYVEFNLRIFFPPPYERVVWYYQDANNDLIQRSISQLGKRFF